MKNLKYIIGSGVLMLLAIFTTVSCTDGNDWDEDGSYDRLFGVQESSLGVSPEATTATVTWTKTPGTEYYIIEVSKDSLYNDVPMNNGNSIVFGEDQSVKASPYILTNLDSNNKYFIRIKAMSSTKAESKWTYLEKKSFKTKSEQIMNAVSSQDKTSNSVRLSWTAGASVTRIELSKDGAVVLTKTLEASEISTGETTLTGLEAGTSYQADLYNNDTKRGYALFSTFAEAPGADKTIYLLETDVIDQTYLDSLAVEYPGQSITLALAADATYTVVEKLTIPSGMSVNFFGIQGSSKTVLNLNIVDYAGSHNFITFKNLNLDCLGKGYLMNQSAAGTVNTIEFDDCIIQNVATSFFRMQGTVDVKEVNSLIINNCIVKSVGSGYYFIHVDAGSGKGVLKNLTLSNSTFNNICASTNGKGFIYSKETNMESITISNCTMYKIAGGSNYFVDFSSTAYGTTKSFSISNTILGMTGATTVRGVRASVLPSITNTYATSDWAQAAAAVTYSTYSGTAAALFTNPDNSDFSIKDGSFDSNIGDPRWRK